MGIKAWLDYCTWAFDKKAQDVTFKGRYEGICLWNGYLIWAMCRPEGFHELDKSLARLLRL